MISADSLVWALPSGNVQSYGIEDGNGAIREIIPLALAANLESGLFVTSSSFDEIQESPSTRLMSRSPTGQMSRKKVDVVLIELLA